MLASARPENGPSCAAPSSFLSLHAFVTHLWSSCYTVSCLKCCLTDHDNETPSQWNALDIVSFRQCLRRRISPACIVILPCLSPTLALLSSASPGRRTDRHHFCDGWALTYTLLYSHASGHLPKRHNGHKSWLFAAVSPEKCNPGRILHVPQVPHKALLPILKE